MSDIVLRVVGLPAPQGSKKAWVNKATGRAQMREQSGDRISLWRQDVKAAAQEWVDGYRDTVCDHDYAPCPFCVWNPLDGPLRVEVTFLFPRPKSHYRTGANAHLLRDAAPAYPTSRATGDIDKLCRATCDALVVAGMFADDSQIADLHAEKRYNDVLQPGAIITLRPLAPPLAHAAADPAAHRQAER